MKSRRTIRHFTFEERQRGELTLGTGTRLVPAENSITLVGSSGSYSTAANLAVRTRLWSPTSAQGWLSFEVVAKLPKDKDGGSPTSVGFRLSRDGVNDFVWGGASWVTPSSGQWSTEAQVCAHVGAFFTQFGVRALQFVVNLKTTNADFAPSVSDLKLLWKTNAEPIEDAITRSLVPDLKAKLRADAQTTLKTSALTTTFTVSNLGLETGYQDIAVDAVFDETADPSLVTDILASFSGVTATLTSAVPTGHVLRVRFTYRPVVAVTTSRDFKEVAKLPAVTVYEARTDGVTNRSARDSVVNKSTGDAVVVDRVEQGDLVFHVEFLTGGLVDHQRLAGEIHRYFSDNPLLRLRGIDEDATLWLHDEYATNDPHEGDEKDIHRGLLVARIKDMVFSANVTDAKAVLQVVPNLSQA